MKFLSNKEWNDFKVLREKQDKLDNERKSFEIYKKEAIIDIENKQNTLDHKHKMMQSEFELKEKQVVAAYEDKLSKELSKLEEKHRKELTKLRDELTEKSRSELEKMLKDNYAKLSESMQKLHEEGNATTKHMQEMTKEVIRAAGFANGAVRSENLRIEHVNPQQ